jgi:hypothetical protein
MTQVPHHLWSSCISSVPSSWTAPYKSIVSAIWAFPSATAFNTGWNRTIKWVHRRIESGEIWCKWQCVKAITSNSCENKSKNDGFEFFALPSFHSFALEGKWRPLARHRPDRRPQQCAVPPPTLITMPLSCKCYDSGRFKAALPRLITNWKRGYETRITADSIEGRQRSPLFDDSCVVGREHCPAILKSYTNHMTIYITPQKNLQFRPKTSTVPEPM